MLGALGASGLGAFGFGASFFGPFILGGPDRGSGSDPAKTDVVKAALPPCVSPAAQVIHAAGKRAARTGMKRFLMRLNLPVELRFNKPKPRACMESNGFKISSGQAAHSSAHSRYSCGYQVVIRLHERAHPSRQA